MPRKRKKDDMRYEDWLIEFCEKEMEAESNVICETIKNILSDAGKEYISKGKILKLSDGKQYYGGMVRGIVSTLESKKVENEKNVQFRQETSTEETSIEETVINKYRNKFRNRTGMSISDLQDFSLMFGRTPNMLLGLESQEMVTQMLDAKDIYEIWKKTKSEEVTLDIVCLTVPVLGIIMKVNFASDVLPTYKQYNSYNQLTGDNLVGDMSKNADVKEIEKEIELEKEKEGIGAERQDNEINPNLDSTVTFASVKAHKEEEKKLLMAFEKQYSIIKEIVIATALKIIGKQNDEEKTDPKQYIPSTSYYAKAYSCLLEANNKLGAEKEDTRHKVAAAQKGKDKMGSKKDSAERGSKTEKTGRPSIDENIGQFSKTKNFDKENRY